MQDGTFHNFYLPYREQGALISPEAQALQITRAADAPFFFGKRLINTPATAFD
jgi:hypothetical protein